MSDYVSEEGKRVGNTDRDRYIDQLAAAISTGHISEEEFGERRDKALTAVIKSDLQALVNDLPDLPKPKRTMVTYQVAGDWYFSPVRWGIALVLSSALIVLPGPLMAASMICAGVALLLGLGIAWAPSGEKRWDNAHV